MMFVNSLAALAIALNLHMMCLGEPEAPGFHLSPEAPIRPVLMGRSVSLNCVTVAPAIISWTLNGKPLLSSPRRRWSATSSTTSVLLVRRALVEDTGRVGCHAVFFSGYSANSEETDLAVTWLESPVMELEQPENVTDIKYGTNITMICASNVGSGDIQYYWFRNTEKLTNKPNRVEIKKNRLVINNATSEYNGVYRCSVHLDGETMRSKDRFVLIIKDESTTEVLVVPEDLQLPPKATAVFNCQYKIADVGWFKGEEQLKGNERLKIHKNGSLVIHNVSRRDDGYYSCGAFKKDQPNALQKFSALLRVSHIKAMGVQDFEPILPQNRVVFAQSGSSFRLNCLGSRESFPTAITMWKKPSNLLVSDTGKVRVDDGVLIIDEVIPEHQGRYQCVTENMAGAHYLAIFLVVNPIPKIKKHPDNVTVNENEPFNFKCEFSMKKQENLYLELKNFWSNMVDSNYLRTINAKSYHSKKNADELPLSMAKAGNFTFPGDYDISFLQHVEQANSGVGMKREDILHQWLNSFNWDLYELKWKRDGGKTVKEEQGRVSISFRDGTLEIEKAVVSDRGPYWCELITSAGAIIKSHPASVTIIEKLKFIQPPYSKRLELNTVARIHCKVQGTPPPTVAWYKMVNSSLPKDVSSSNGSLMFSRVLKSHKGNYTCTANNTQGTISATIAVDVAVSPRFISPLASQIIDVTEGQSVWIDCIAEGDPPPHTQWDRNLRILPLPVTDPDYDRLKLFDNGTLHLMWVRMEDGDRYACTAGNTAGFRREEVILVVHPNSIMMEDGSEDGVISKAIFITMSVVGAYMLLVVGLMLWCRARRRRKLARNLANEKLESGDLELKENGPTDKLIEDAEEEGDGEDKMNEGKVGVRNGSGAGVPGDVSEVSRKSQASGNGANEKLIVPRSSISDVAPLGRGEFGEVHVAQYQGAEGPPCRVLLKWLQTGRDETAASEFRRQLELFSHLQHNSVSTLVGLLTAPEPHCLLLEYTDWGDLKQFLVATQSPEEALASQETTCAPRPAPTTPLSLRRQLGLAHQLASAMNHIANHRLIHKDLATRNCLITSRFVLKVSLPALTKDIYSKEYCKHLNQVIPLRWLPQESVYEGDYSAKSDIYMFACTVWEILHKAELPFIKMSDSTVLNHLKNNTLKWKLQTDIPIALYELLEKCWDVSPNNRPCFGDAVRAMSHILSDITTQSVE